MSELQELKTHSLANSWHDVALQNLALMTLSKEGPIILVFSYVNMLLTCTKAIYLVFLHSSEHPSFVNPFFILCIEKLFVTFYYILRRLLIMLS